MPIYAYRCEGCGFQKDALQKLSDPPLVDCPQCGQPKLAKQLTAAGFALKGTGWYVTDFRDSGKKSAATDSKTTDGATPTVSGAADASSASTAGAASSSPTSTSTTTATASTPAAAPAAGST